ncbi:hypothetical protein GGQ64_004899 [Rhizobium azooxidifex]|uniref:Uncharacterized protein n=1 Tax=Mycoplana azooxidifex TaxID=1636188 RepID=A0A7W6GLF8_9HYPH|nr:hypothetical protein [Mycoplana azooxidifex]
MPKRYHAKFTFTVTVTEVRYEIGKADSHS